jgi:hypothetical protein
MMKRSLKRVLSFLYGGGACGLWATYSTAVLLFRCFEAAIRQGRHNERSSTKRWAAMKA